MVEFSNKNINNVEELEQISDYINYGIHFTIVKHLGKIDSELEKKYAIERLNHFMQGKDNAFTSSNGIRTNIRDIDPFYIIALLIKAAIERHAFNIVKLKKEKMNTNEDVVAEVITEQLANGNLDDTLIFMGSDKKVLDMLVENYIDLYYQSEAELKKAYAYMTSKDTLTSKAMKQLNLELNSKTNDLKTI